MRQARPEVAVHKGLGGKLGEARDEGDDRPAHEAVFVVAVLEDGGAELVEPWDHEVARVAQQLPRGEQRTVDGVGAALREPFPRHVVNLVVPATSGARVGRSE